MHGKENAPAVQEPSAINTKMAPKPSGLRTLRPLIAEEKICVCEATKAPVGLLSNRTVLRKQDGGALPRQARICPALLAFLLQQKAGAGGEPSVPAFLRDAGAVSPPSCAPRSRPPSCPAGSRHARHPWRSCGRCGASGAGSCWWP